MDPIAQRSGQPLPGVERKLAVALVTLALVFLGLTLHFWRLQILQHSRYQKLADNNRIRLLDMPATRGIITDRNGVILADSTPDFSLAVVKEDMIAQPVDEIEALARLLGLEPEQFKERYLEGGTGIPYRPVRVFDHLGPREVAIFEADQDLFPGVILQVVPRRHYPFGETAAHVLGYVGEISQTQIRSGQYPGASRGDNIGKYAIEKAYDDYLRGKDGGRQVEVDARGRELNVLGVTEPVPGANVRLTLDIELQLDLERAFGDSRGAGVVLNAQTGEVLAMVSRPAFDPNEFSLRMGTQRWNEILTDPGHPLQSRALQGVYPPGSTFKVVTAIAALMEKAVAEDENLFCSGGYYYGRRIYRDWRPGGHGRVNMHKGIVESCDVYFYQMGERVGMDALAMWASVLGLGRKTGIDLPGEAEGLIPSPDWKNRERGEVWFPGETLSASIGQGYVLVTPLQLANLYATIARSGMHMDPFLVSGISDVNGMELYRRDPTVKRETEIPDEVWNTVTGSLQGVVGESRGTGRAAAVAGLKVAGKTGTAQVVRLQDMEGRDEEEIPYELRDHAWFAGFAPADRPRVVAVVVVEHGGHGASAAAPIVGRILKKYVKTYHPDLLDPPAPGT
ncbi:MAG: penicillin-binding protein 2 [bacterium]|nr:MAG: penicillin-binding protein 2 [bacterium]